jgi:hypothetical protein
MFSERFDAGFEVTRPLRAAGFVAIFFGRGAFRALASAALFFALPALAMNACHAEDRADPCQGEPPSTTVLDLAPQGGLSLSSGAIVRLAGLRLPSEPHLERELRAFFLAMKGRPVAVRDLAPPDRWNRIPASLGAWSEEGCTDAAALVLQKGLAVVDADGERPFDRTELLAHERAARRSGLGVWAEDRYKPVSVGQVQRLRQRTGDFLLVEGRIRSVGDRQSRIYLNFGADWATDFTVVVPKHVWSLIAGRGISATTLKGRFVRVRGIIEEWQGPAMTAAGPDAIEILDNEQKQH